MAAVQVLSSLPARMGRIRFTRQGPRLQCLTADRSSQRFADDVIAFTRQVWRRVQQDGADAFRDATKTPISTSAKPMMWKSCRCSPRKAIAITEPNTGVTWKNGAARLAPINCTPRLKHR